MTAATLAPPPTVRSRAQEAVRTTPGRYRTLSLVIAVLLAMGTAVATASAAQMRSSARRAQTNSGPVLVATQQLISSLAEADATASAAFLSGRTEDPEQRRLYTEALGRATQQLADIAQLAGNDATIHATVERISLALIRYGGLVEAARASDRSGAAGANAYLVSAVSLADTLVRTDMASLALDAQDSFGHDQSGRTRGFTLAVIVGVAVLVALVAGQAVLARTSRRLFNPALVLATVMVVAALSWLAHSDQASGHALAVARRQGYDSIVLTAKLAGAGFAAKADETLALITKDAARRGAADTNARAVAASPVTAAVAAAIRAGHAGGSPGGIIGEVAGAADSPRERAAVAETGLRWQRYETTVGLLRVAPTSAAAAAIATGQANADFNGFNFSIEAILGQNRDKFFAGLASAAGDTAGTATAMLLLLLGALAASLWGFQVRINDYR